MIEYLTTHWNVVLGIVIAVAVLFGGKLQPLAAQAWEWLKRQATPAAPVPLPVPPPEEADPDVLDMLAIKRLRNRRCYDQCPEAKKALDVLMTHFFHETPPPA
ncbi:MAG TPA: hypothetical protein VFV87_14315 [Pirellulaceae bacterium]|nr:hypothetical protein [Pirellulaceae bacterium]